MGYSLSFTERMAGDALSLPAKAIMLPIAIEEFPKAEHSALAANLEFTVTVEISDLDQFLNDQTLWANITGTIKSDVWGECQILKGDFNLFEKPVASTRLNTVKEMHYCLYFETSEKEKLTLYGFKSVEKEDLLEAWSQTTTLFTCVWKGHSHFAMNETRNIVSMGVLHISMGDFIHQLGTLSTNAPNGEKLEVYGTFFSTFAKNLWQAYAPFVLGTANSRWNEHYYPIHTDKGVAVGEKQILPFDTEDGLTLSLARFRARDCKNVVLLLHGLTTSTDMFIMPEHQNLVNYLHKHGYTDVWSLDWRGSGRHIYNLAPHRYTIDDVAKYDVPAAVQVIRNAMGSDIKIHVICHCVGSIGFMTSLASNQVSGIQSVISNSVSLTPKVRWQSFLKLVFGPFFLEYIFRYHYVGPKIPYFPGFGSGKWIYWMERLLRRECREPACHMVSFMWGWGFPAAYKHENLHPVTHRRLMDLFGGTSYHYYRHIRKMLFAKEAIPYDKKLDKQNLPDSYLQNVRNVKLPPLLLISGSENHIFPGANKITAQKIRELLPDANVEFVEIPGYGHQDVFMGKKVHVDVFPKLLQFLKQHS